MNISQKEIEVINGYEKFLSFKPTWVFKKSINTACKIVAWFTGNQFGKTCSVSYSYVLRILGIHPIPKKNIVYYECEHRLKAMLDEDVKKEYLKTHKSPDSATWIHKRKPEKCSECGGEVVEHKRNSRVFRFCSVTLPGQSANVNSDGESAEVKNTQYPEFKKWLPTYLIKKDITFRNPAMTVKDPFGGADIIIEFVSYNQSVPSTAGSQRVSCWLDEQPPPDFLEEQLPRLLAEDGDVVITCTPADRMTYLYDDVFEKSSVYYRSEHICKAMNIEMIEETDSKSDIAVIQAATDDNPTLGDEHINSLFNEIDDPDVLAIRRYGIFKQVSGRIQKSFQWNVHVVNKDQYFPEGIPADTYNHFRGIDYHEAVNWACGFMSISPTNEAFIWGEFNPSPENMITFDIARELCVISKDYKFTLNLIDPLASKKQLNTGISTIEDLNRAFLTYKREGLGTGGYWMAWDTKSTRGREEVRKRLMNSVKVGKPFNNQIVNKKGHKEYLPTLWILDNCRQSARSMKNWRLEEWANNTANASKDKKEQPQQKWSHFNMVWEAFFKHPACKPKRSDVWKDFRKYEQFQGAM
jgi:phage terminase large subunit-like protein